LFLLLRTSSLSENGRLAPVIQEAQNTKIREEVIRYKNDLQDYLKKIVEDLVASNTTYATIGFIFWWKVLLLRVKITERSGL
jgi:uncharacterized protein YaaR (DUF327 family)